MSISKWKQDRCKWCAKGGEHLPNKKIHKVYPLTSSGGFQDAEIKGPLSEYLPCTAPTEAEYIAELEQQITIYNSAINEPINIKEVHRRVAEYCAEIANKYNHPVGYAIESEIFNAFLTD